MSTADQTSAPPVGGAPRMSRRTRVILIVTLVCVGLVVAAAVAATIAALVISRRPDLREVYLVDLRARGVLDAAVDSDTRVRDLYAVASARGAVIASREQIERFRRDASDAMLLPAGSVFGCEPAAGGVRSIARAAPPDGGAAPLRLVYALSATTTHPEDEYTPCAGFTHLVLFGVKPAVGTVGAVGVLPYTPRVWSARVASADDA